MTYMISQEQRHDRHDHARERQVLLQCQDDPACPHDGSRHQHGEHQDSEGLDLLGVVGGPGDQALGPKPATSCEESDWILRKTSCRSSWPIFIATSAPKYPAVIAAAAWTAAAPAMRAPSRRITAVSPGTMPSSMIAALMVGSSRLARVWISCSRTIAPTRALWAASSRVIRPNSTEPPEGALEGFRNDGWPPPTAATSLKDTPHSFPCHAG